MIVCAGDCLVDLIQSGRDGAAIKFDGLRGGSTYNTALAAARQSAPTGFLTPMSTDTLGQFMIEEMANSGVAQLMPPTDAPTSLAVVTLSDGIPSYQFYRQGVADRATDLAKMRSHAPADMTVLHISSLGLAEGQDADDLAAFFAEQPDTVLKSVDPNIRALLIPDRASYLDRLWKVLASADVIKLSDEDLEWIFETHDLTDGFRQLMEKTNAPLVVLTMGEKGARANFQMNDIPVPVGTADPFVDSVGAGDTFMGTMLAQLNAAGAVTRTSVAALSVDQVTAILNTAARAAAINCSRKGCNPPWAAELK